MLQCNHREEKKKEVQTKEQRDVTCGSNPKRSARTDYSFDSENTATAEVVSLAT